MMIKIWETEREESYYPYAKTEETSVRTGDKPLVTAYSNVSEKYFIYGNICLNLGGFTPRTRFLHKLKTEKKPVGLQVPSLLLLCSFTSGPWQVIAPLLVAARGRLKSGTATCSRNFQQQCRHDSISISFGSHWYMMACTQNLFLCNVPTFLVA